MEKIVETFSMRVDEPKYSRVVDLEEVAANDYNLFEHSEVC